MADSAEPQWTVSWVTEDDEDDEEEEVVTGGVEEEVIFGVASDCVQLPQHQGIVTSAGLAALVNMKTSPVFLDDAHSEVVMGGDLQVITGGDIVSGEQVITGDQIVTDGDVISGGDIISGGDVISSEDVLTESEIMTGEEVITGGDLVAGEAVVDSSGGQYQYQDPELFGVQVIEEEVISEAWETGQTGHDGQVLVSTVQSEWGDPGTEDDMLVPLPQDQQSGASQVRPYPCDFCSRRFSKKANLMNHMVAHQVERPYGCNLCGARYRRKCDLHNHLKIHAYAPDAAEQHEEEEEDDPMSPPRRIDNRMDGRQKQMLGAQKKRRASESFGDPVEMRGKKKPGKKPGKPRGPGPGRKKLQPGDRQPRSSYVDEDMRLLTELASRGGGDEANGYYVNGAVEEKPPVPLPPLWPVTDPSRPHVCQHCGIGFAREKALCSHSRVHAGDSPFECSSCGEMFWDVHLLREHMRLKHPGIGVKVEREEPQEEEEVSDRPYTGDERFGNFRCQTCGLEFHRQDLLKKHSRLHLKMELGGGDPDMESGSGRVFSCNVCGQSYGSRRSLLAHTESHSRYQPHRCMLCGQGFPDDQLVAAHVRERHAGAIPDNACQLCGKTCKDRRALQKHSWVHSSERSYSCPKCDKRFHSRARLRRHMVSHRERVLTCAECGATFPDGRSLVNHRLAVHSQRDAAGRLFQCRDCGKTFGSRSSQQIHIRIHTGERPYACRFCWKAFADGGTLRKHERIHTGEKPYACPICPRAFNQRVVLREHIRAHHSGPDPKQGAGGGGYVCKVCGMALITSEDLCLHLVKHSDENTARHRKPALAPRKYKRRRKLKPHELAHERDFGNPDDPGTETDSSGGGRKVAKPRPDYESVVRTFDAAMDTINSMVGRPPKVKKKRKMKRTGPHGDEHEPGTSMGDSMLSLNSLNRLDYNEMRPPAAIRIRPRIKNVSAAQRTPVRPPKATKSSPSALSPPLTAPLVQEEMLLPPQPQGSNDDPFKIKKGPRTKNVNYHHEKRPAKPPPAKFPKEPKVPKVPKVRGRKPIRKPKFLTQNGMRDKKLPAATTVLVESVKVEPVAQVKEEVKEEFKCEICGEIFYTRPELLFHVSIHI